MYSQTRCSRRHPSCKAAWPRWSWNIHVSRVCTNLLRVIFLRRKLRHGITEKYLVNVYHSLLYHTVLLCGHSAACKSVLLLQKKALWTTVSVDHFETFWSIFQCLGIPTVYCIANMFSTLSCTSRKIDWPVIKDGVSTNITPEELET